MFPPPLAQAPCPPVVVVHSPWMLMALGGLVVVLVVIVGLAIREVMEGRRDSDA